MRKVLLIYFFLSVGIISIYAQQQNNTVIVQQNTTPIVIEKPVYIERYRTVYVDRPQPKRVAKKLSAPLQLLGYLWVYPEDLGNFKQQPLSIIENINSQNMHGRDNWRIPTPDELAVLEANAENVGLGDDIYLATDHSNGVLRLVSTNETKKDKAVRQGNGVLINGTVWANRNIGANTPESKGREFTFSVAQNACPEGWRLPTVAEFNSLINSGHASFGDNKDMQLFLPYTKINDGNYGSNYYCKYWTSQLYDSKYAYIFHYRWYASRGGYGNPYSSGADDATIDTESINAEGVCVRCVMKE